MGVQGVLLLLLLSHKLHVAVVAGPLVGLGQVRVQLGPEVAKVLAAHAALDLRVFVAGLKDIDIECRAQYLNISHRSEKTYKTS